MSLTNLSKRIIITVLLQFVVVLSFQIGLNSTSAQILLHVTTNKTSNLTEPISGGTRENTSGVQILTNRSFIDSDGNMHIVGEVINNSSSIAVFVTIVGTIYDIDNKVLATQFTYTNPVNIESDKKAPFELIVTPASVPISSIDHYHLQINYE